jgi:uncharacterized protein
VSAATQGPETSEQGSLRTCIVTRQSRSPDEMIRFVLGPEGRVVADIRRKLPGRGVWVTACADLVAQAVASRGFARGFKTAAVAPPTLPADVEDLLEADALQSLSLANKAGLVTTGAAKVEATIARELPALLVQARDGRLDGARKVRQALIRRWGEAAAQLPWIDAFGSSQLDLALGRTNVIHAALKKGPAAGAFLARCRRLAWYRGQTAAPTSEENSSRDGVVADDADGAQDK